MRVLVGIGIAATVVVIGTLVLFAIAVNTAGSYQRD